MRADSVVFNPTKSPAGQYIWAVVSMLLFGLVCVLGILWLRPQSDPAIVLALVGAFLAPTTMSLLGYLKAQETHVAVNSRLDAWMKAAERTAFQDGADAERTKAVALAVDPANTANLENRL